MRSHSFAIASRDEIWVRGVLVQQRIEHGEAHFDGRQILARDSLHPATRGRCDALASRHLHFALELDDCRVRLVTSARSVEAEAMSDDRDEVSISISLGRFSVVTTPEGVQSAVELLRGVEGRTRNGVPASAGLSPTTGSPPFVWLNGSAAVLLHEAAGHAAEHGAPAVKWPEWLTVRDVPRSAWDDTGCETSASELLGGEVPASFRRASFRDVPLRRMVDVVVEHRNAPFAVPGEHVEIHLVEGGSYDPLTDVVSLRVAAADFVRDGERRSLEPFEIVRARGEIAASLIGASGESIRYPGVVCSREGQELLVGSSAPVMLTRFDD